MPKESKKFINPLLRPSQEVVAAPPHPQKNLVPEIQTEGVNNGDEQALTSEKPLEKPFLSTDLPASLLPTLPSTSTSTSTLPSTSTSTSTLPSTSTFPSTLPSTSTFPSTPTLPEISASPFTSTLPSTLPSTPTLPEISASPFTSTLPSTSTLPEISASPFTSTLPSTLPSTSTLPEISTSPSTSTSTLPSTDISLETVIHGDMQSKLSTNKSSLRKKQSAPERTRDSAIEQSGQDMSMLISTTAAEPVQEEKKQRPMFSATEPVRRKRGPLAFEKTHERITLWIDKGLKQAFEELAYEQELPKTALLNEAIADLLKKYDLR